MRVKFVFEASAFAEDVCSSMYYFTRRFGDSCRRASLLRRNICRRVQRGRQRKGRIHVHRIEPSAGGPSTTTTPPPLSTYSLDEAASVLGLSVPRLRYYAETYGAVMRLHRDEKGWCLHTSHLDVFRALARGVSAREALRAYAEKEREKQSTPPPEEDAVMQKLKHLNVYVEDLAEESKQLQVLLSRLIEMLTVEQRPRGIVRRWVPPRLAPTTEHPHHEV